MRSKTDPFTRSLRTKVKSAKASKNKRADKEKDKDKEVDREHERAATPSSDVNTPSSGQSSKRRNAAATPVNTGICSPFDVTSCNSIILIHNECQ